MAKDGMVPAERGKQRRQERESEGKARVRLGPVLQSPYCEQVLRSMEVGSAGPYTGTILLSTESLNPPAPPYRGKLACKKWRKRKLARALTMSVQHSSPCRFAPDNEALHVWSAL
ncbi:hypothetical protein Q8A73_012037 [Channa argus]|nr:hypothetical protein Q8A73_012037 [Channa argus]